MNNNRTTFSAAQQQKRLPPELGLTAVLAPLGFWIRSRVLSKRLPDKSNSNWCNRQNFRTDIKLKHYTIKDKKIDKIITIIIITKTTKIKILMRKKKPDAGAPTERSAPLLWSSKQLNCKINLFIPICKETKRYKH
jgi:hypothetical protein